MNVESVASSGEQVLLLAPTAKGMEITRAALTADGVACASCRDVAELCHEMEAGAGTAVLTEYSLSPQTIRELADVAGCQPAWSDLPVILLVAGGTDTPMALCGHVPCLRVRREVPDNATLAR